MTNLHSDLFGTGGKDKIDIDEIARLNGLETKLLGEDLESISESISGIGTDISTLNNKIILEGVGGNKSTTVNGGSGAFIVGARQSTGAKVICFFDGIGGITHFVTATNIVVSVSGSNLTVTNNTGAWFTFLIIKA